MNLSIKCIQRVRFTSAQHKNFDKPPYLWGILNEEMHKRTFRSLISSIIGLDRTAFLEKLNKQNHSLLVFCGSLETQCVCVLWGEEVSRARNEKTLL